MLDFLKTMPDMTNTPEITMIETPKIPMAKRIRDYKAANPNATAKQVSDAVGSSVIYVYQVLNNPPKKIKKEKPVTTSKAAPANTVSLKEHEAMVRRLAEQTAEVMDLEEDIVGLKAIIKYLEEKLEEATF